MGTHNRTPSVAVSVGTLIETHERASDFRKRLAKQNKKPSRASKRNG
jgi:hypothetical protein